MQPVFIVFKYYFPNNQSSFINTLMKSINFCQLGDLVQLLRLSSIHLRDEIVF